ncbi:hypothetical protein LCGC14_0424910 [marine sediment metagenome]|uniref:Uncharacterized protein n=1 Tax=marine sediment metagenome TaxID=412755 RepID=A0A0F9SW09_9ZZZZ
MISTAGEGWTALYKYTEGGSDVVLARMVAAWVHDPDTLRDPDARTMVGIVIDDMGKLQVAHDVERFICYCAPDDNPEEIIKRRANK